MDAVAPTDQPPVAVLARSAVTRARMPSQRCRDGLPTAWIDDDCPRQECLDDRPRPSRRLPASRAPARSNGGLDGALVNDGRVPVIVDLAVDLVHYDLARLFGEAQHQCNYTADNCYSSESKDRHGIQMRTQNEDHAEGERCRCATRLQCAPHVPTALHDSRFRWNYRSSWIHRRRRLTTWRFSGGAQRRPLQPRVRRHINGR